MSMQIQVNPAGLSQEQREAIAGFILAYPQSERDEAFTAGYQDGRDQALHDCAGACHARAEVHEHPEITALERDAATDDNPVQAFGHTGADTSAAVAAFGTPLPPATAAEAPGRLFGQFAGPAPAVTLDSKGLPWDARIHASSKSTIADGSWRKKKSVDDATITQVEAELRALMSAPAPVPQAAPVAPVPQAAPVAPVPQAAPVAPVPQAAPVSADPAAGYVQLIQRCAAAVHAKKITQEEITSFCVAQGVPALPLLANRLDLLPAIALQIDTLIASRP